MKTKTLQQKIMCKRAYLFIACIIILSSSFGQTSHIAKFVTTTSVASGNLLEYYNSLTLTSKFGIGISPLVAPTATFQIKDVFTNIPILRLDESTLTNYLRFLYYDTPTGYSYGMYQSGNTLKNYFEGSIGTNIGIYLDGAMTSIDISNQQQDGLPFYYHSTAPGPALTTPLLIKRYGCKISSLLECTDFQLYDNAGLGKLLVSDQDGNGIWTDPSLFNDKKWVINTSNDMYAYPRHASKNYVGIGFTTDQDKIYERLHIVDGNILLTRYNGGNTISENGAVLFGDVATSNSPHGKWGIEYFTNGLNFMMVAQDDNISENDNYHLFLANNGSVGIGTNDTKGYKLGVNGSIICTELKVKLKDNWPDDVLKNDYNLLSLKQVEDYINKNQHLPGIPSAKEVHENGVNVGEMNAALLAKIEELTKYMIEQQKQIDELRDKIVK